MRYASLSHKLSESEEAKDALERIDYDFPTEPRDDAGADEWREYGLSVADKLAEAQKATDKAAERLDAI